MTQNAEPDIIPSISLVMTAPSHCSEIGLRLDVRYWTG